MYVFFMKAEGGRHCSGAGHVCREAVTAFGGTRGIVRVWTGKERERAGEGGVDGRWKEKPGRKLLPFFCGLFFFYRVGLILDCTLCACIY